RVQGVRLNYRIVVGGRDRLWDETALRYDADRQRLRQEVQYASVRAAKSSHSAFAPGPGSLATPGGGDRDRQSHPAPPGTWALMWAWGRSLGACDSGRASCPLQGRETARRAWHGGAVATGAHACLAQ